MADGIEVTGEHMAWAKDKVGELVRLRTELVNEPLVEPVMSPLVMDVINATRDDLARLPALLLASAQFVWMVADFRARDSGRDLTLDDIDMLIEAFQSDTTA